MISTQELFESSNNLPWRKRAEIYILHNNNLVVGKANEGFVGYNIPGGGVDEGEKPIDAAKRESLEEIGVKVKNLKSIKTLKRIEYSIPTDVPQQQINHFKNLIKKYKGAEFYTFIGEYNGHVKQFRVSEMDTYKTIEITISEAINFYSKPINFNDNYAKKKATYVVEILNMIKNKL